jgi:hypothetical protein
MQFFNIGGERMRITSAGNVGIGTTSPGQRLTVSGGYISQVDGGVSTFLGYDGTGSLVGTTTNHYLRFITNDTERMRITSGGNVGINSSTINERLVVTQTTNNSSSVGFYTNASTGTSYGPLIQAGTNSSDAAFRILNQGGSTSYFQVRGDGLSFMPPLISSFTTGSAANMFVSAGDGAIYRSTSSIKYKKNVEDYDKGLTEIMQMRPVFYEGISESDEGKIFAGLIAEEVHDLGLTEFVQYAEDGSPDSLAYQNMVALLIKSIQELKTEIDSLKNQIK